MLAHALAASRIERAARRKGWREASVVKIVRTEGGYRALLLSRAGYSAYRILLAEASDTGTVRGWRAGVLVGRDGRAELVRLRDAEGRRVYSVSPLGTAATACGSPHALLAVSLDPGFDTPVLIDLRTLSGAALPPETACRTLTSSVRALALFSGDRASAFVDCETSEGRLAEWIGSGPRLSRRLASRILYRAPGAKYSAGAGVLTGEAVLAVFKGDDADEEVAAVRAGPSGRVEILHRGRPRRLAAAVSESGLLAASHLKDGGGCMLRIYGGRLGSALWDAREEECWGSGAEALVLPGPDPAVLTPVQAGGLEIVSLQTLKRSAPPALSLAAGLELPRDASAFGPPGCAWWGGAVPVPA